MVGSSSDSIFPSNILDMTSEGLVEPVVRPLPIKARLIIDAVEVELREAVENYGPIRSFHEGYAILREEVDELWDEIKVKPGYRNKELMRKEAVQVAAMAVRFILDTLPDVEV